MTIGIDASMLVYEGSGVANYTYNLIKHLLIYDKKNNYKVFYSSFRKPDSVKQKLAEFKKLGAKIYICSLPPRVLKFIWNSYHLIPIHWLIGDIDAYHSSDFLRPPLLKKTKGITTIHDLTWKIFPEYHTKDIVEAHERKLQKTIKYGDIVIVDSENTKKDLLKYYPQISKKKIHVIYLGVDDRFRIIKDQKQIKKVLEKYNIKYPANYLLYVGAIEPRKNLNTSVEVFAELIKDKKFSDYQFLLVGRAGWKNESIFQLIRDLGLKKKVKFVGFVTDNDLPYFYNASKLTVYLSKYEGFGLPPIESLKCGTPAIAGNNSSLIEILPKDYLVNLDSKSNILFKIKTILDSKKDVKIEVISQFSWSKYVEKLIRLIK